MNTTYQLVLFNDEDDPKFIKANTLLYDSIKNGWTKEMKLGTVIYGIGKCRSFEVLSEIFGTTYYLIIDVKRK